MEEMQVDDAFVTAEITEHLAKHHIKRTQPTPYEHGQNGDVEVLIKHNQETVYKLLDAVQLDAEYWGLALLHNTDIRELLPSVSDPTISRGVAWGHTKTSLNTSPLLPFGSRACIGSPTFENADGSVRQSISYYFCWASALC